MGRFWQNRAPLSRLWRRLRFVAGDLSALSAPAVDTVLQQRGAERLRRDGGGGRAARTVSARMAVLENRPQSLSRLVRDTLALLAPVRRADPGDRRHGLPRDPRFPDANPRQRGAV